MIIYTYYEPIYGDQRDVDQKDIVELWKKNWERRGWKPFVMNQKFAEAHPSYKEWCERLERTPSVNDRAYEMSCFKRWMALIMQGGGWMCDYDVYNLKMPPMPMDGLFCGELWTPSLVYGTKSKLQQMMQNMVNPHPTIFQTVNGQPHYSDMLHMEASRGSFAEADLVKGYPDLTGHAVHLSSHHCGQAGVNKLTTFKILMETHP